MATNGIGIGISTNTANDTNGDVKSQQKPDKEQLVLTPDPTKKPRVAVIGIISNGRGQVVAGRRIGPLGGGGSRLFPRLCLGSFSFHPSPLYTAFLPHYASLRRHPLGGIAGLAAATQHGVIPGACLLCPGMARMPFGRIA